MKPMRCLALLSASLIVCQSAAFARDVDVSVDTEAATAVLDAVRNPQLTIGQALDVARLPGNQGLVRKARSYGRPATDDLFARALVAAARRDTGFVDEARFHFDRVRDSAGATERAIVALGDPQLRALDTIKARIAAFTPPNLKGQVAGFIVAGGTSGGFAFGEPQFYLNLDRFPSAPLAATIMSHELFHAVQALAHAGRTVSPAEAQCMAAIPHGRKVADFFGSLSDEGTASYVGDVLALPETDAASARERARFARNLGLVGRSITQLELSVHGLTTGAAVSPAEVYELGFYGDEVMYALGYVMARAIAREQGDAAVATIIGQSGAAFVQRYVRLKGYGKRADVPALKAGTTRLAARIAACDAGVSRDRGR